MPDRQTTVHAKDRPKIERGMLLLGGLMGKPGEAIDQIWCVARVSQRTATLVRHSDNVKVEATLKPPTLPEGWRIINNRAAARALLDVQN